MPALEHYRRMREAARLLASCTDEVTHLLTEESGKPLAQTRIEVGVEVIDRRAEEMRRSYGRVIPARGRSGRWPSWRRSRRSTTR